MSLPSASALRIQIEAALADRIPSALTPAPRILRPVAPTGIAPVDQMLHGGIPLGAITEVVGPECSGRTSFALSFISKVVQNGKVCAWIDVSDTFDPESAAAAGVNLEWLLWVRCGAQQSGEISFDRSCTPSDKNFAPKTEIKGPHGGGFGRHPRTEVQGLSDAVEAFLRPQHAPPCSGEPQPPLPNERSYIAANAATSASVSVTKPRAWNKQKLAWSRIDKALRVTDLLLQAGGFDAIVLDLGSVTREYTSRIPLATWFRFRTTAERCQASILLLTQHSSAKSSAGLLLTMKPAVALKDEATVFTGVQHDIAVSRERFEPSSLAQSSSSVIPIRKPPQSERCAAWVSRTTWSDRR